MVVKRSCSFCAGEIEPGTGSMFVKRDGTVFHFCSSSCRKQQLNLGRVGHRVKWTRAHALKRAAEQTGSKSSSSAGGRAKPALRPASPSPAPAVPSAPSPPAAAEAKPEPAAPTAAPKKGPKAAKSPKPRS